MKSQRDLPTSILWGATTASICIAFWLLWGAGLFRPGGSFLKLSALSNVGSFLSGVFTPLAIGWAARSFLLQRQQMAETLLEMQKQLDLQRVAIEEQRTQAERERIQQIEAGDPALQVSGAGIMSGPAGQVHSFLITNHRATAQRLKIFVTVTDDKTGSTFHFLKEVGNPLIKGVAYKLELEFGPEQALTSAACTGRMTVLAERVDGLVSEFTFEAKGRLNFKRIGYRPAEPGLTLD